MTNHTILIFLLLAFFAAGCIAPDVPEAYEQPQPDYPDTVDLELTAPGTATPTETATPHHIADADNMVNDDRTNWSTCDPRHNESWLYLHKCGMYGSGSGGADGSAGCPPSPIPELPTCVSFAIGIAGCIMAGRSRKP
jgi:hypothetical protein